MDKGGPERPLRLTTTDRAILGLLTEDSRRTTTEIASALGVSRTTVMNRMAALRARGVIRRFTIEIDSPIPVTSASSLAFFLVQLHKPDCRVVYQSIRGWPELVQAWSVSGETDFVVHVRAHDSDGIESLRQRLVRHPEVSRVKTIMALQEWVKRGLVAQQPDGTDNQMSAELVEG